MLLSWIQTEKDWEYQIGAQETDQQNLIEGSGGFIFNPTETGFSTPPLDWQSAQDCILNLGVVEL